MARSGVGTRNTTGGKSAASTSSSPPWMLDDSTLRSAHRLGGLEPDNLLAFMALLGLLRALGEVRPTWRARAFWDIASHPWRPVLTLAEPQTQAAVAQAAAAGVRALGATLEAICVIASKNELEDAFEIQAKLQTKKAKGDCLTKSEEKALEKVEKRLKGARELEKVTVLARSAKDLAIQLGVQNPIQRSWIAALAGWLPPTRKSEARAGATPLKLTSGQQAFAGLLLKLTKEPDWFVIARSLFYPWHYKHRGDSLRFSPVEARRYAYMAGDPTVKKPRTDETGDGVAPSELGANILAGVGLLSLPVVTVQQGLAIAGHSQSERAETMRWPIWTSGCNRGSTLAGIEAMLQQAALGRPMEPIGIVGWQECYVFLIDEDSATSKYKSTSVGRFVASGQPEPAWFG